MLPLLPLMAIGAIGGALTSKKPLKGALLGAGLGATAGAAAPAVAGLFGSSGAAAAAGGAAAAPGAAGFGLGQPLVTGALGNSAIAGGTAPSTMSTLLGTATKYKPVMDAAATGVQMSGAMDPEQPMQVPEMAQQIQGGGQTLASLAGQGEQASMMAMQADEQERARRRMQRGFS